jgi:PilZ domain
MSVHVKRPYRKNLSSYGLIYMGGEEYSITVRNISLTGVLVKINQKQDQNDLNKIYREILAASIIDMYIPTLRLAGETEAVRVDIEDDFLMLALEFKNVTYDIDRVLYRRRAYRKTIVAPGLILLDGIYHEFYSVNASVDGLMIRLPERMDIEKGLVTVFEFKQLEVEGEITVIWSEQISDHETLVGLQYLHIGQTPIKGVPRFYMSDDPSPAHLSSSN